MHLQIATSAAATHAVPWPPSAYNFFWKEPGDFWCLDWFHGTAIQTSNIKWCFDACTSHFSVKPFLGTARSGTAMIYHLYHSTVMQGHLHTHMTCKSTSISIWKKTTTHTTYTYFEINKRAHHIANDIPSLLFFVLQVCCRLDPFSYGGLYEALLEASGPVCCFPSGKLLQNPTVLFFHAIKKHVLTFNWSRDLRRRS